MDYKTLDRWLVKSGRITKAEKLETLGVTGVTLTSWERRNRAPIYMPAFCIGHTGLSRRKDKEALRMLRLDALSVVEVRRAMSVLGIETQNQLAVEIGYTKQAVSLWFKSGTFPGWLGVVLYGLLYLKSKDKSNQQAEDRRLFS